MKDVKDVLVKIAAGRSGDPKPKRFIKLYTAMLDREITFESMKTICYAIGSIHREAGMVRTDRVVGIDPGRLTKDTPPEGKAGWWTRKNAYRIPKEKNEVDKEWIEQIGENMGDSYELTEEEERWVHYILKIPLQEELPISRTGGE